MTRDAKYHLLGVIAEELIHLHGFPDPSQKGFRPVPAYRITEIRRQLQRHGSAIQRAVESLRNSDQQEGDSK